MLDCILIANSIGWIFHRVMTNCTQRQRKYSTNKGNIHVELNRFFFLMNSLKSTDYSPIISNGCAYIQSKVVFVKDLRKWIRSSSDIRRHKVLWFSVWLKNRYLNVYPLIVIWLWLLYAPLSQLKCLYWNENNSPLETWRSYNNNQMTLTAFSTHFSAFSVSHLLSSVLTETDEHENVITDQKNKIVFPRRSHHISEWSNYSSKSHQRKFNV